MTFLLRKADPKRPCPHCGRCQSRLTRHMACKHKNEEAVQKALALPKAKRDAAFTALRRDGILKINTDLIGLDRPEADLLRERDSGTTTKVAMCSGCNVFFSLTCIWRHKKRCCEPTEEAPVRPTTVPIDVMRSGVDEFKSAILVNFHNDEVGRLCLTDKTILLCGERLFQKLKKKPDKATEVKRSVMADMRKMGHLYREFCKNSPAFSGCPPSAEDMLHRENFPALEEAVNKYTSTAQSLKARLKLSIYYLLKSMAKTVRGSCLIAPSK